MEKKEAARLLYMEGDTFASIAKLLGVSETTLTKWANAGDWKSKRTLKGLFEQTSVEALKELADYQLKALVNKKDELLKEGKWELLDKGHFDALSKAFSNIKGPELKWEQAVRIMRRFMEYLQANDLEAAKRIEEHTNIFINDLRKQYNQ